MASSLLTLKITKVSSPFGPWEAHVRPGHLGLQVVQQAVPSALAYPPPSGSQTYPVLQRFSASPEGVVVTLRPKTYQSQLQTISN